MIDVGGDDGPPARDLVADKLWRDMIRDRGPKILTITDDFGQRFTAHIFADGDIFHLRRDDPGAGIGHLGHSLAANGL